MLNVTIYKKVIFHYYTFSLKQHNFIIFFFIFMLPINYINVLKIEKATLRNVIHTLKIHQFTCGKINIKAKYLHGRNYITAVNCI